MIEDRPLLIEDRPYIPSPMSMFFVYYLENMQYVQLLQEHELYQIIRVLFIISIIMDQCKRNAWTSAWSLLRERGYHLDVFLYLLATCLTPVCKALGRPLLLVELYAGVYVVYRVLLIVVWVIVFCAEYFDLPPLAGARGRGVRPRVVIF